MKQTISTADLILESSTFPGRGHQLCSLLAVRIVGKNPVLTHRANWMVEKRIPIPPTHDLYPTCDLPGCIASDHWEMRPKKQADETKPLKERIKQLEAQLSEAQQQLAVFHAALHRGTLL